MTALQSRLRDASVRTKILLGYGVILLLMLVVLIVVLVYTASINYLNAESDRSTALQVEGEKIGLALADRTAAFRDFLLSGQDTALLAYRESDQRLSASLTAGLELAEDSAQIERLGNIADLANAWSLEVAEPGIALRQRTLEPDGPPLSAAVTFSQSGAGRRNAARARAVLRQFQQRQNEIVREGTEDLGRAVDRIQVVTVLAFVLALLLGFVVTSLIAGAIARPLTRAVGLAEAVANGDFTQQLPARGEDEVGRLIAALNRMAKDLRRLIGRINTAAVQVASAAEQIAATSQTISSTVDDQVRATEETSSSMEEIAAQIARVAQSTESLAASVDQTSTSTGEMSHSIEGTAANVDALGASVEETSATIEEMVASIAQVGRHVRETREIARSAQKDARSGGEAVTRSTAGMRRISEEMGELVVIIENLGSTGESIGRISEVIQDIADQTNLLALNAAIEAARAGEHGRGFAVVAQEIRRLSERSVESTREISATVRGVRTEVGRAVEASNGVAQRTHEGIELAEGAAAALEEIIGSSARTRDLMEEVSLATEQQIEAAEQAQTAVRHIQQITEEARVATRQQAHASRQIAEATENMNRQTQEVFSATAEQKRGGELVLASTESVSQGARAMQGSAAEVVTAADDLSAQASRLTALIQEFRV